MGVHNLWDLLTATALPVRVESLFGKVCCIDASFWIIHCLASESVNRQGGDVIAVFFLRICYLLDKGIKPVFVFDGKSPFAKIKTIVKRKMLRNKLSTNHKLLAFKLLETQVKNANKYVNVSNVVDPLPQLTNQVEPTEDVDNSEQNEEYQQSAEVSLFDLFPYEFLNKTDEDEFDKELKMLQDCDFLPSKSKYELISAIRDNIIQKDRDESLKLKGEIDKYSKHQIQSYMRDMKINGEIERLKNELYQRYPLIQQRAESLNLRNELGDEVCDYNDYFSTNFENNYIALKSEYENDSVFEEYAVEHARQSTNEIIDDSVFATDDQIFGTEMLSGIDDMDKSKLEQKVTVDNNDYKSKSLCIDVDGELQYEYRVDSQKDGEQSKNGNMDSSQLVHSRANSQDETPIRSNNDFFLGLYKQYFSAKGDGIHSQNEIRSSEKVGTKKQQGHSDSDSDTDKELSVSDDDDEQMEQRSDCGHEVYIEQKPDNIIQPEQTDKIKLTQNRMYYDDTQALLELFGIPYLIAPSEAESQCAYMNKIGDCYAVISDDSDALVFGAKCLLKNFYNDYVFELYTSQRIRKELGIGREQLALIAVICGCDYTNGVRGIGVVNALEVIKAYPKFEDLYEFKHWATSDCSIESATSDRCPLRSEYKKAHINYRVHWTFSSDFPNREAYDLFLNPTTTNEYNLTWERPKFESLLEFMSKKSLIPPEHVKQCVDMLYVRRSQQFIMEDIIPDISSKGVEKKALSKYRKSLKTNLSAFRKTLIDINLRSRFNINTNRHVDRDHTLSKIRSKRMVESIKTIKKRHNKRK